MIHVHSCHLGSKIEKNPLRLNCGPSASRMNPISHRSNSTFLPSSSLAPASDPSHQCVFPKVSRQTWLAMFTWRLRYWVCQLWRTVMGTRLILYCISFIMNYKFKHTMSRVSGDCEKYDVIRRRVSLQGRDTSSTPSWSLPPLSIMCALCRKHITCCITFCVMSQTYNGMASHITP